MLDPGIWILDETGSYLTASIIQQLASGSLIRFRNILVSLWRGKIYDG
jgi:hypothetical protein